MDQQNNQYGYYNSLCTLNPDAQSFIPYPNQQASFQFNSLLHENQKLQQETQKLQHEKQKLQYENQKLQYEKQKLQHEKQKLQYEKQKLQYENQILQHQVKYLEKKVDDMKQNNLDDQIRITGVQEDPTKTPQAIVLTIAEEAGLDIREEDIKESHRIVNTKQTGKSTITVQLKSTDAKNKVLKSAKKLASIPKYKKVSINPNLTPKRHQIKIKAHMEVKKGNIKGSWVWKSDNYIKGKDDKIHKILTMEDLNKFTDRSELTNQGLNTMLHQTATTLPTQNNRMIHYS